MTTTKSQTINSKQTMSQNARLQIDALVSSLVRPEVQQLSAYHVPPASNMVKLDAMENPYTWSPELIESWLQVLKDAQINRYPDPSATDLIKQLRTHTDIPEDAAVLLGNGSDELIQMLAMALARPGAVIVAPDPSFVMYRMIALMCNMEFVAVPLQSDFSLDQAAMLATIEEHNPALLFLAYPNNPTGNLFSADEIKQILETSKGVVVLDEAYAAFTDKSFMHEIANYPNLLVMRTVSKMGLAGLRLGYLVGDQRWLSQFDKVRLPYNINVLTQLSTEFALRHYDVLMQQTQKICHARSELFADLKAMDGIRTYTSQTNFILFKLLDADSDRIFASLKKQGVLVKNMHVAGPALRNCIRVTVSTPKENKIFINALKVAITEA